MCQHEQTYDILTDSSIYTYISYGISSEGFLRIITPAFSAPSPAPLPVYECGLRFFQISAL